MYRTRKQSPKRKKKDSIFKLIFEKVFQANAEATHDTSAKITS